MLAEQNGLDGHYVSESDNRIFRNVTELSEYEKARTVFVYCSIGREADTRKLIERSLSDRKRVAVPRTTGGAEPGFAEYTPGTLTVTGSLGIPEPGAAAARLEPGGDDIVIVPGLAFDERGYRLGRGGGFYDRYLSGRCCFKAGLCRERFLVNELPTESFDIRMDCVVTEERVIRFRRKDAPPGAVQI